MAATSPSRAPAQAATFSRRVVIGAAFFALFVVFDIGLFSYLILNSLSQRELEKVLLETRQVAEPIAQNLNAEAERRGDKDLYVVMSTATETQTYIDSVMAKRELVKSVEIRDRQGKVVYQQKNHEELPLGDVVSFQAASEVEVPIGELGTVVIGVSDEEVQKRIEVLRRDLTGQATLLGVVTILLLLGAFAAFVMVYRRSQRLEAQAREAERMAYIGTLASGLAHEIRSPLNSLSLNMQMLEEEVHYKSSAEPSASQQRLLSLTRAELKRLERLASDFLSYARPQALEKQPVRVSALLARVQGVLDGELRSRKIPSEVLDESGGAVLDADPAQLVQLLLNLAFNAIAAIEASGRTGAKAAGDGLLRLIARRDGEDVVLAVADNGEGIPPEVKAKMFDLFYSNRKGGTGLGLAIVERIAQVHGASLRVETALGEGTTVSVRFPAVAR